MRVVGMSANRQFRLGCFDASGGSVVLADDGLPLAVEIDGMSGAVRRVFTWPVSPELRGRPVALDVLLLGESVMVASPAAGGVIRLDRRSGESALIPLEADVGTLTACGDAVWAVAGPDWYRPGPGGPLADGGGRTRPVVWEEPTAAEIARDEERSRRIRPSRTQRPPGGHARAVADPRRAEGDCVALGPATPVWHIRGGAARRIDVDWESPRLAAVVGSIAAACQLPGDPLIKHVSPGGRSVSYRSPGTIIMLDEAGTVRLAGRVASIDGVICEDRGRAWLLGFDSEPASEESPGPRELLADGQITASLDMPLSNPVGVVDGRVADLSWQAPAAAPAGPAARRTATLRFLPVDGGEPSQVPLAGLGYGALAKVRDGRVWIGQPGGSVLKVVTPDDPAARDLCLTLDCRPWMTRPQPAAGLDLSEFESGQLNRFRAELLSTRADDQGQITPLVDGLTIDAVELRGTFPDSQLVALFHSADRPAVQFGRRRSLYDELGNPVRHQYAHVYLAEHILTDGLPSLRECAPDDSGVVWI